jgi:ribosomal-protein-alanine N-acetyltransferase
MEKLVRHPLQVYTLLMIAEHEGMILHETKRVMLRRLISEDQDEFLQLVKESAKFLHPWVRLPANSEEFEEYIQRFNGSTAECILICDRESRAIAGTVNISNIIRTPYQCATVGYNAFKSTAGLGYMSEGFQLVFRFAFGDLGLHRLEADIQPNNEPSLGLARRVGFRREGYSPAFICIDGIWKDHERWAIISDMIKLIP